ncbi:TPA: NADP-dependent oxidoreductase [Pseudomonas aeruginosa]|nr:NADP-dependent oxidoreductase [Pseudomonas aeruginosa]HBP6820327.1 NADP-dependent oxidoreductase [Pseudomonas aeruginosa]
MSTPAVQALSHLVRDVTMKSIVLSAFGTMPIVDERPLPVAGPQEILIRMTHASLNPIDWRIAEGFFKDRFEHRFPLTLGIDGAGVVESIGEQVSDFEVGDSVFGRFLHSYVGNGSFSEYVAISADATLLHTPLGVPPALAAALPTAATTALQAVESLGLPPGSVVLIMGATGGVGTFAVQLARAKGYQVLASASTEAAPWLAQLGVEHVFDRTQNVPERLSTGWPAGINGLIDLVNPAPAFAELVSCIAPGGTALSSIWSATADVAAARGVRAVNLEMLPNREDLRTLARQVLSGSLRVVIDKHISLEAVPAVMSQRQAGGARGKTVIDIA